MIAQNGYSTTVIGRIGRKGYCAISSTFPPSLLGMICIYAPIMLTKSANQFSLMCRSSVWTQTFLLTFELGSVDPSGGYAKLILKCVDWIKSTEHLLHGTSFCNPKDITAPMTRELY